VVVRTSPLGMQKEAESRQSVRRATEGLHGGVRREQKSLGAVAESGQPKEHMAGLPRVSASLSDIMRTDDAVPVDFLKREDGRILAAPWVSFLGGATSTSAANIKSFLFLGPAASKIVTCSLFSLTMRERGA
jgi:hypothetical protein